MRHTRSLGSPAYKAVERQGEDRGSETEKDGDEVSEIEKGRK